MTVPGVGGVVALSYTATLDTPSRFGGQAGRVSAYLGLVPGEYSSGERQWKGQITKVGPSTPRALLVQAAWTLWRQGRRRAPVLWAWVERVAARRGRRIAVTALARRLSRICTRSGAITRCSIRSRSPRSRARRRRPCGGTSARTFAWPLAKSRTRDGATFRRPHADPAPGQRRPLTSAYRRLSHFTLTCGPTFTLTIATKSSAVCARPVDLKHRFIEANVDLGRAGPRSM
jgi:hypothetical protein